MVKLYNQNNIQDLNWEEIIIPENEKCFLLFLVQNNIQIAKNINSSFCLLNINKYIIPVVINNNNYNDSYTNSIYSHYINYLLDELELVYIKNKYIKFICKHFIIPLGNILKIIKINKCIYINNLNLSTNLYTDFLTNNCIEQIKKYFLINYPEYTIIFRSINKYKYLNYYKLLKQKGFQAFLSRQIYFINTIQNNFLNKNDTKKDLKLLNKTDYFIIQDVNIIKNYIPDIINLYNDLYINKYSTYNPQFTEEFIKIALESRFFKFFLFQNNITKQIDAVLGFYTINNINTAPIVGYKINTDKKLSLYRRLSILLLQKSLETKSLLHLSSGAGQFKLNRGAEKSLEYSLIYYKHLPFYKKLIWFLLQILLKPIEYIFIKFVF